MDASPWSAPLVMPLCMGPSKYPKHDASPVSRVHKSLSISAQPPETDSGNPGHHRSSPQWKLQIRTPRAAVCTRGLSEASDFSGYLSIHFLLELQGTWLKL